MSNEAQRAITHFWFDVFESGREYDGYELAEIAREHFRKLVDYDLLDEIKKEEESVSYTVVCMICGAETEITGEMVYDLTNLIKADIFCSCSKSLMRFDGGEILFMNGRKVEDE